jgi:serine/threonine protein kinase/tetratricopeptide (TPR) repeat protein
MRRPMSRDDREVRATVRLLPGTLLAGRYRIVHRLGGGGMGEVYRAQDLKLEQEVALKFLPTDLADEETWLERFLDEVRLARQISHPNVCRVYDVGEVGGSHFLTMELVPGDDLERLLARIGRLPLDKALEMGRQVGRGIAAAHDLGILHRDLKPANLILDAQGEVRVLDFGLATLADGTDRALFAGTPAYMAPERLAGEAATVAGDLYALGLVLYRAITGRPAFAGTTVTELLAARREGPPAALSLRIDGLPPAVDAAILGCLAAEPERRPASALVVVAALDAVLGTREAGQDGGWRPAPGIEVPQRPHWVLERELSAGGAARVWLALHEKTREPRAFKLAFGTEGLAALEREVTVSRLLRQTLGARDDLYRVLDWSLREPPYRIETEYTAEGSLLDHAAVRGGIGRIPLGERLELVAQVATALAAVHSAGVLHRDVKPGNVLIDRAADGAPRARLGDFGLGSVTDRDRLAAAGITIVEPGGEASSLAGTRLYLAPELLEGKPATPRTDVYALGVMLYQIVVGDFSRALAAGWDREIDDGLLVEDIAAAVDGSPERRLGDAGALAERLRRRDERCREVAARRQAEATRRRLRLAAGTAAGLALGAGALAVHAHGIAREAAATREVAGFLSALLVQPQPAGAAAREVTLREILDRGGPRIERELAGQPEIQARLWHTLGVAYGQLGLESQAIEALEKALATRRQSGEAGPELADTEIALAALLVPDRRAETLARTGIAARARLFGESHPAVAEGRAVLAGILNQEGRYEPAEEAYRQALEVYRRPGGDPIRTAGTLRDLAAVLGARGRVAPSRAHLEEALAIYHRRFGPEHIEIASTLTLLAILEQQQGKHAAAIHLFEQAHAMKQRLLGSDHPHLVSSLAYLAEAHWRNGDLDAAEKLFEQALELSERLGEPADPVARSVRRYLAEIRGRRAHPASSKAVARSEAAVALSSRGDRSP